MLNLAHTIREFASALVGTEFQFAVSALLFICVSTAAIAFASACLVMTAASLSSKPMQPLYDAVRSCILTVGRFMEKDLTYASPVREAGNRVAPYLLLPTLVVFGGYLFILSMFLGIAALLRMHAVSDIMLLKAMGWSGACLLMARALLAEASRTWAKIRERRPGSLVPVVMAVVVPAVLVAGVVATACLRA